MPIEHIQKHDNQKAIVAVQKQTGLTYADLRKTSIQSNCTVITKGTLRTHSLTETSTCSILLSASREWRRIKYSVAVW